MLNRTATTFFLVEVLPCPTRSMGPTNAGTHAEPLDVYIYIYILLGTCTAAVAAAAAAAEAQAEDAVVSIS